MILLTFLLLPDNFREHAPRVENETSIVFYLEPIDRPKECPKCKELGTLIKHGEDKPREIRDTDSGGKFVGLVIKTPRYKCKSCNKTSTHKFESIHESRQMTKRLVESIEKKSTYESLTSIAEGLGFKDIQTVKRIADNYLEEMNKSPLKTPKKLAVVILHMKDKNRLFFIDLETYNNEPSIIDIQSSVSVSKIINVFKRLNTEEIDIVLTEAHMKLWRWIKLNSSPNSNYQFIIHGRSLLKENEQQIRDVFELMAKGTDYSISKRGLNTNQNKDKMMKLATENESFKPYLNFYESTNQDFDKSRGFYKNLASAINVGRKNKNLDLLNDYFINIINLKDPIIAYDALNNKYDDLYLNLERIIKNVEKEGPGHSYDILRNRILYGSKATKRPTFVSPAKLSNSELIDIMTFGKSLPLKRGFHVPISELIEIFKDD